MTLLHAILISFAAICCALMDVVDHYFEESIFRNWNQKFWNKEVSSDHAPRVFGFKVDCWHLSKAAMIWAFIAMPFVPSWKELFELPWYLDYAVAGAWFILVFNLFYNRVFFQRRKMRP
jgi:hypothetical protein